MRRRTAAASVVHLVSGDRAVPEVGSARVVRILVVVDLPAPFGPSMPNTVPRLDLEGQAAQGLDRRLAAAAPVGLGEAIGLDRECGEMGMVNVLRCAWWATDVRRADGPPASYFLEAGNSIRASTMNIMTRPPTSASHDQAQPTVKLSTRNDGERDDPDGDRVDAEAGGRGRVLARSGCRSSQSARELPHHPRLVPVGLRGAEVGEAARSPPTKPRPRRSCTRPGSLERARAPPARGRSPRGSSARP